MCMLCDFCFFCIGIFVRGTGSEYRSMRGDRRLFLSRVFYRSINFV